MFTEKHHAFIVSSFYKELKNIFGNKGIDIFVKAAQTYGEQRGKRMSLRALRDGYELTYLAYFAYSEWRATPGWFDIKEKIEKNTVYWECYKCPWNTTFMENEILECGICYCKEIDKAIVRGFNPDLEFEIKGTQHNENCCRLYFTDDSVNERFYVEVEKIKKKNGDKNIKCFDYHCGHVFNTFKKTLLDVDNNGESALTVINNVKYLFSDKYDKILLEKILEYDEQNFCYL